MNVKFAQALVENLCRSGVQTFCVCPGSRNAPFVAVLERAQNLDVFHFFDERSAAFFALGRSQRDHRPVAIVTTSGTAVAELLPAMIEAHYRGLPLIAVTADRPKLYRKTAAPQSIEQPGLFSHYVKDSWDVEVKECQLQNTSLLNKPIPMCGPLHINVCFDEPLIDSPIEDVTFTHGEPSARESMATNGEQIAKAFAQRVKSPLVILGPMQTDWKEAVESALHNMPFPVYAEAPSGLRERSLPTQIRSGERFLKQLTFDGVIRLGSVPTARLWRDLQNQNIPVLHISDQPWPGLTRGDVISGRDAVQVLPTLIESLHVKIAASEFVGQDQILFSRLEQLLEEEPASELGVLRHLSTRIPIASRIFLGNSLPIREWDLAATFENREFTYGANRGANGIDGQISTFLGWCQPERENWAIVGDLTALYDLNSAWPLLQSPELQGTKIRIVIVNNFGGQIFTRLYQSPSFVNAHKLNFSGFAKLWNLPYLCCDHPPEPAQLANHHVIELTPDNTSTARFWKKYEELWR